MLSDFVRHCSNMYGGYRVRFAIGCQTKRTRETSISISALKLRCLYPIRYSFRVCVCWCERAHTSLSPQPLCMQYQEFIHSVHCLANINIPCHMWNHVIHNSPYLSPAARSRCNSPSNSSNCSYSITAKMEKVKQQIPFKKQQIHTIFLLTFCSVFTRSIHHRWIQFQEMNVQLYSISQSITSFFVFFFFVRPKFSI